MVRTCACAGAHARCCAVHVLELILRSKGLGEKLFEFSSAHLLKQVRRLLGLLGHRCANQCTLKGFRAGRATSLAAAGSPLGVILAAGEWRSAAFLRYCHADELSVTSMIEVACEDDDDED